MSATLSLSIAPMMDRSDRHFRYLMRLLSPSARLYTEMITAHALLHGDAARLLRFDPAEHPVAAQLGGNDPDRLAAAARLVAEAGYDEVNLNCGCPSSRVQAGAFGARLMLEPALVADAVRAMREAVPLPVTVKTRIGVDDHDDYEILHGLTAQIVEAGASALIVHARKAWLKGLSPKQNRDVPPLDYPRVYRLKDDFPALPIEINGGFTTEADVLAQRGRVDGVMLGRVACDDPMLIARLDARLFSDRSAASGERPGARSAWRLPDVRDVPFAPDVSFAREVLVRYARYMRRERGGGVPLRLMARHLHGLARGRPGARRWRQLTSALDDSPAAIDALVDAFGAMTIERASEAVSMSVNDP